MFDDFAILNSEYIDLCERLAFPRGFTQRRHKVALTHEQDYFFIDQRFILGQRQWLKMLKAIRYVGVVLDVILALDIGVDVFRFAVPARRPPGSGGTTG